MTIPVPRETFYSARGKRVVDVILAAIGLFLLFPLLAALALLVKLSSTGPAFFRQQRVGCAGKIFRVIKFRSMFVDAERRGLLLTSIRDPRVTPIGRVLRRLKLDELPQLWNVLTGEMSMVGPRPEVACYVESYSPAQRQVLSVRPGITDPASIIYRQEEDLLGRQPDPDRYYREVVLPAKLALNLKYLSHMSFAYDLRLLLRTVVHIVLPSRMLFRSEQGSGV
jgi:lipopolysaccharide/colanic/teichoic acid biosynthesis glycosyltransferase